MRRLVAVFLAVSMLALPSAAAAQSAGDEQYADPFGQTEQPNDSQGQPAPEPQPAPAPATPAAPAAPAEQALASQQTAAPTLPATGMPAHLLASMGALLLASGALLRRRAL
jgi:LPXTG-motif cell wall-anchored protein